MLYKYCPCYIKLMEINFFYNFILTADPNFYSTNLLMLGKTYLRMNKKELAAKYLKKARDAPIKKPDDKTVNLII